MTTCRNSSGEASIDWRLESFSWAILLTKWEMEPVIDSSGLDSEASYHVSSIYYFFLNLNNQKQLSHQRGQNVDLCDNFLSGCRRSLEFVCVCVCLCLCVLGGLRHTSQPYFTSRRCIDLSGWWGPSQHEYPVTIRICTHMTTMCGKVALKNECSGIVRTY